MPRALISIKFSAESTLAARSVNYYHTFHRDGPEQPLRLGMKTHESSDSFNDPEYLRKESRRLCNIIETSSDPEVKKELATHSLDLAQRAEAISRTREDSAMMRTNVERHGAVLRSDFDNAERQTIQEMLSQSAHLLNGHLRLHELAVWYRSFAERAGNPFIWEARLRMAEDLEAEAERAERRNRRIDPCHGNTATGD